MYIGSVPVPVHCLIDSHSPCDLCELNRLRQSKGSWGPRGQSSSWALCAVTLQRCVSEDLCRGRGHLSPHKVTVRQRRPYTQIPFLLQSCDQYQWVLDNMAQGQYGLLVHLSSSKEHAEINQRDVQMLNTMQLFAFHVNEIKDALID